MTNLRTDLYARVTNAIIADLENGVRPWLRPWSAAHAAGPITRPLRAGGRPYTGINVLTLWESAVTHNFTSPVWMTFKQAKGLNASVRRGSKGSLVVYADRVTRTERAEDGEERERDVYFMKGYTVFNAEQVEGLPGHYYAPAEAPKNLTDRLDRAEAFFAATGADTRRGGARAFYSPSLDVIQLPPYATFESRESYYATRAHESVHWTGHAKRLARSFDSKRFGDDGYAVEELVAELGAAFLAADLGLTPEVQPEHASYLAAWLKVLKADTKAIFTAASHASKAAEFLHGLQPKPAG